MADHHGDEASEDDIAEITASAYAGNEVVNRGAYFTVLAGNMFVAQGVAGDDETGVIAETGVKESNDETTGVAESNASNAGIRRGGMSETSFAAVSAAAAVSTAVSAAANSTLSVANAEGVVNAEGTLEETTDSGKCEVILSFYIVANSGMSQMKRQSPWRASAW